MNEEKISQLLSQAGSAHHVYEQTVLKGVYDDEWPAWYAGWAIENGLNTLLPQPLAVEQLAQFLAASNRRYGQTNKQQSWADYTAADLVAQFG